jgi:hypothetical protein
MLDKLITYLNFFQGDDYMEKNVGLIDSYMRLSCGIFMVGWGISKKSPLLLGLGAMKVAEGATRFCPMLHMLGMSSHNLDKSFKDIKNMDLKDINLKDMDFKNMNFKKSDTEAPEATV